MDASFVNEYRVTKKLFVHWILHPANYKKARARRILWGVLFLIAMAAAVYALINSIMLMIFISLLLAMMFFFRAFLKDRLAAGTKFEAAATARKVKGGWDRRIAFTDKGIDVQDADISVSYEYKSFVDLIDLGDEFALLIRDGKGSSVRLPKEGFTKGNVEDFPKFMHKKLKKR
ncbi:MAG: YcxB family protein [Clostridia bacterium]|nr:YcxB family protein [Clostridia bacterium]